MVGLGNSRFFFNADDIIPTNLRHSKALGIRNLFQQNFSAMFLTLEVFSSITNIVFNDVVAENDADWIAVSKIFRQSKSLRDTTFTLLIGVIQMLQTKILSVSK